MTAMAPSPSVCSHAKRKQIEMPKPTRESDGPQDGPTKCRIDYGRVTLSAIDAEPPLAHALATAVGAVCGKHDGAGSRCVGCGNSWTWDRAPDAYGIITAGEQPDGHYIMLFCEDCTAAADGNIAGLVRDFGETRLGYTDFHRAPAEGAA